MLLLTVSIIDKRLLTICEVYRASIAISVVTEFEIIAGAKDLVMQKRFEKLLNHYIIISLDSNISFLAIHLYKKYKLSHGLDMPDSLIAATAIELDYPLFTYNIKDFRFIPGLKLYSTENCKDI